MEIREILPWERKNEIDITKPLQKTFVGALEVYNYLPKTNCTNCGEKSCMVFAVKHL